MDAELLTFAENLYIHMHTHIYNNKDSQDY